MKLFGSADARLALEELEIEKIVDKQDQPGGLVFDEVNQDVKDQVEEEQQPPSTEEKPEPAQPAAQASSTSSTEPGDRVSGDTEVSDTDSPGNGAPEGSEEADLIAKTQPEEATISTEAMRQILSLECANLDKFDVRAFEDSAYVYGTDPVSFRDKNTSEFTPKDWREWGRSKVDEGSEKGSELAGSAAKSAWSFTKDAAKWLGGLGIKLSTDTLPKLAGHTYKGIIYGFDKLGYSFMVGLTGLEQYIKRRVNSFDNLHANIKKAQQALDILKNSKLTDLSEQTFSNVPVIKQLATGDELNLVDNLNKLNVFINDAINGLGVSIKEDLAAIGELIAHSHMNGSSNIYKLLEVHLKMKDLHPGEVDGFQKENRLLSSYFINVLLPGNTVLIAHLPSPEPKERAEWMEAYRESEMFMGIDRSRFKLIEEIPYSSVEDLVKILDLLEHVCESCIKHQHFYENMKQQKLHQRLVYKNYFDGVVNRHEKTSIKDSLIDLVTLKNNFIDKVYLPASIDIHDYAVRVINAYLRYVEQNMRALKS